MPKYRISLELTQTVIQRYWEEFDTSDQDAWDSLRSRVFDESVDIEIDIDAYPARAPSDPNIWFALYKELHHSEYANQDDDDWISDRNGSTEHEYALEDEEKNIISSD